MKTKTIFFRRYVVVILCILLQGTIIAQKVTHVEHVTLTVSDLQRSVEFYTNVLGFAMTGQYRMPAKTLQQLFELTHPSGDAEIAVLRLGDENIELMEFKQASGRSIPHDSKSNDLWFQHLAIVVSDMDAAYLHLRSFDTEHISTGPQTLPVSIPAAAGISAFYFRDPDGHPLELIHYPIGKGDPRWQSDAALFLGIDHTAIGIERTKESLVFYQDLLQMKVAGTSENSGTEQEHLNQVFGAKVLITGMKAEHGFGIEFLDYIAPPGGREYPGDSKVTDLWHVHTTLTADDLELVRSNLSRSGHTISDIVHWDQHIMLTMRDPDGHVLLLRSGAASGSPDSD